MNAYKANLEKNWKQPPPGTELVTEGVVQKGDWFYIDDLGVWAVVPEIGIGETVNRRLIARGTLDTSKVVTLGAG